MSENIIVEDFDPMMLIATQIKNGALGEDVVFCMEEEKFYIYRNNYWKILHDIQLSKVILDSKSLGYVKKHAISKRNQILENLKHLVQLELDVFNKKGYLNFDIGEFCPETLQMYDHDKSNYSTMRIEYPYHHTAKCDLWLKTLGEIFENDQDKIDILQEFFGYCLTRNTRREKALLLLGDARTGKSSILHVLNYLVGENNCSNVALKYIAHPQYTPLLMNKLVNMDTDVSGNAQEFEAEFKTITSGEPITCNQKFVETFKFRPYCKMVMAANEFPSIKDHSSAFYKRLILLPCDRIFEEHEQNINLKDELLLELSGIFNWAVEGLRRLNERGYFEQKDFMKDAVQALRDESNPTEVFMRDHVEDSVVNNYKVFKSDLYEKYVAWCDKNGSGAISINKFNQAVFRKYSKITEKQSQDKATGKRYWKYLRYVDQKGEAQGEVIQWQD